VYVISWASVPQKKKSSDGALDRSRRRTARRRSVRRRRVWRTLASRASRGFLRIAAVLAREGLLPFDFLIPFDFAFALDHQKIPPPPHPRDRCRLSTGPREIKRQLVCLNLPTTQREWNRCSHSSNDRAPVLSLSFLSNELQPPPHPREIY
jgi:hypothetical protein